MQSGGSSTSGHVLPPSCDHSCQLPPGKSSVWETHLPHPFTYCFYLEEKAMPKRVTSVRFLVCLLLCSLVVHHRTKCPPAAGPHGACQEPTLAWEKSPALSELCGEKTMLTVVWKTAACLRRLGGKEEAVARLDSGAVCPQPCERGPGFLGWKAELGADRKMTENPSEWEKKVICTVFDGDKEWSRGLLSCGDCLFLQKGAAESRQSDGHRWLLSPATGGTLLSNFCYILSKFFLQNPCLLLPFATADSSRGMVREEVIWELQAGMSQQPSARNQGSSIPSAGQAGAQLWHFSLFSGDKLQGMRRQPHVADREI